jgi:hypothetical protein
MLPSLLHTKGKRDRKFCIQKPSALLCAQSSTDMCDTANTSMHPTTSSIFGPVHAVTSTQYLEVEFEVDCACVQTGRSHETVIHDGEEICGWCQGAAQWHSSRRATALHHQSQEHLPPEQTSVSPPLSLTLSLSFLTCLRIPNFILYLYACGPVLASLACRFLDVVGAKDLNMHDFHACSREETASKRTCTHNT